MARGLAGLLIAILVALPSAQAATAAGEFLLDGPLRLPEGASFEGAVQGLLIGGTAGQAENLTFETFLLTAPELRVTRYWKDQVAVDTTAVLPGRPPTVSPGLVKDESYELRNVTVFLQGPSQPGYLAVTQASPDTYAKLISHHPALVQSLQESNLASSNGSTSNDRKVGTFHQTFSEAHVRATLPGSIDLQGEAEVKAYGLSLRLDHDGGTLLVPTGLIPDDHAGVHVDSARQMKEQWAFLEGADMHLLASASRNWEIVAPNATLEWQGVAEFNVHKGTLSLDEAARPITNQRTILEGEFNGLVTPTSASEGVRSYLYAEGTGTGGPKVAAAQASPTDAVPSYLVVGITIGLVLGGTGTTLAWRHHQRKRPTSPPLQVSVAPEQGDLTPALAAEYYMGLAEQAIQFEDHAKALHWVSLAREAAPTSANVVTTLAYVLGELGQFDEALAAYEEASVLSGSDGEADLNAARLAAQAGKPVEEVERFVLRALERSPEFVFDVEEDPEFHALAERPVFRQAVARAWTRWGDGEENAAL